MIVNWIGKYNLYLINKINDVICFMVKKVLCCSCDFKKLIYVNCCIVFI